MAAQRFEELIAWQKVRELTKAVYEITRNPAFAKDFGLCNQIQRASVSVMSNIAEGFERSNPAEFHQSLVVAKASCAEVRSQLYVALDIGYITPDTFNNLLTQAEEVSRIISGLRTYIEKQRKPKR